MHIPNAPEKLNPIDPPLDYLIFHPARARCSARGEALIAGRAVPWEGTVWADRVLADGASNEDPFIWTTSWLYSYCHATQLRRVPRQGPFVRDGSRLFFCSASEAKGGQLAVDTVFKVARCVPWNSTGQVPKDFHHFGLHSAERMRHLRHGTTEPGSDRAHVGRFTYIAAMSGESFLPMDAQGRAYSVLVAAVMPEKGEKIFAANPVGRNSYPVMLTPSEAATLLTELQCAPVRVTSIEP